jgi:signal transduction histidine kinase
VAKFDKYHELLASQLQRHRLSEIPKSYEAFLAEVSETYQAAEKRLQDESDLHAAREKMLAAQKHEELGTLAHNVAKDFNDLLAIVGGHALMLGKTPSPAVRIISREISLIVQRGLDIAKQILTFSKRDKVEFGPVNINEVLLKYRNLLQASLKRSQRLELKPATENLFIIINEGQFAQIILNLAVNARDAMQDEGCFTISVKNCVLGDDTLRNIVPNAVNRPGLETLWRHGASDREFVCIEFLDTGVGISEEVLKRIFEPYFTTKSPTRGTGLGLAVAYSAIKQSKGYIFCSSQINQGTTFHLLFPKA